MKAIEFLKNKGITKATCYTDSGKTYYVNELAELMEEYVALCQSPVIGSVCACTNFRETPMINGKHICSICNKPIVQTSL